MSKRSEKKRLILRGNEAEYEEAKVLGTGAHGRAHLVVRKGDDALLVVKRVYVAELKPNERAACEREVDLLKKVSAREHPNIIKYYEHFENEDGELCIVMNYAQDGDLDDVLNWHKDRGYMGLPEDDVASILAQLCSALALLHDHSILHRDLKPGNVFVSNSYNLRRVLLGDFGIARQLSAKTVEVSTVVGTPFYMSPEIVTGLPYDYKSDVWGIGCIAYEMMTLRRAFPGDSLPVVIMAIHGARYQRIQPESGYSGELRMLIDRCLSKDPAQRPTVKEMLKVPAIARALEQFEDAMGELGGQEAMTPPRSPALPFSPNGLRRMGSAASSEGGGGTPVRRLSLGGTASSRGSSASMGPLDGDVGAGSIVTWGGGMREPTEDTETVARIGVEERGGGARLRQLQLGRYHKVALTVGGEVYTWMYGGEDADIDSGELGHGDRTHRFFAHRVAALEGLNVVEIACGAQHTLARLAEGGVLSWGCGVEGQLGHVQKDDELRPRAVEALLGVHVTKLGCGARHSVVAGRLEGRAVVYSWGAGEEGQLGHGPTDAPEEGEEEYDEEDDESDEDFEELLERRGTRRCRGEARPRRLDSTALEDLLLSEAAASGSGGASLGGGVGCAVEGLACGDTHTALLAHGVLLTWGSNERGALGRESGEREGQVPPFLPGRVAALDDASEVVVQVSCGAHHTAALCSPSGALYMWGESKSVPGGGSRSRSPAALPIRVDGPWSAEGDALVQVCGGDMFTAALTAGGRVYTWGGGIGGRLGDGAEKDRLEPEALELGGRKVVGISCTHVMCGDMDYGAQTMALVG